ncbi:hypothetical protein [Limnohabitans sp. 15K]|uniref:hypothetical protein n=1 Tax=Limnohabitans sp. 15K TaxID=1100706 RepID=UPI000C1DE2AE|nr:hypothetical protein [Limnohabitans sp. 15K]PIT83707.1 hypothetical protein B9Z40_08830 [Limnohabitans sp. 15K]
MRKLNLFVLGIAAIMLSGCGGGQDTLTQSTDSPALTAPATAIGSGWMARTWGTIKDKRLDQLVIPGTHDSGTAFMDSRYGMNTARTQSGSIGTQLSDGIRYLDFRVEEATHRGCADDSVWWFNHGMYRSETRLMTALDEISAFLGQPANAKEFLILDFQDITLNYDDGRARDNLLSMIERRLGSYLAKTGWQKKTLSQLFDDGQRVVVVLGSSASSNLDPNYQQSPCGNFDRQNFTLRGDSLISAYEEFDWARDIKSRIVDAQLNLVAAMNSGNAKDKEYFDAYRSATENSKLRVLQLVVRPSNNWFVGSWGNAYNNKLGFGFDLLTMTSLRINGRLNYNYNEDDAEKWSHTLKSNVESFNKFLQISPACPSGWLGKRLRMGLEGDSSQWNRPNIVIVDNYAPGRADPRAQHDWILPDYVSGQWVNSYSGSYVDMFIQLNKIRTEDQRLKTVVDLSDDRCL